MTVTQILHYISFVSPLLSPPCSSCESPDTSNWPSLSKQVCSQSLAPSLLWFSEVRTSFGWLKTLIMELEDNKGIIEPSLPLSSGKHLW